MSLMVAFWWGVIFVLTGARISHESKCVSQALEETEGRCIVALTLREVPRLLGVKCDTSLGRCWFSVAAAQQTSSHGYREWRGRICGGGGGSGGGAEHWSACSTSHTAVIWQLANRVPRADTKPAPQPPIFPAILSLSSEFIHFCWVNFSL